MKNVLLLVLLFISIFAFWFGLKMALRTEFPLLAVASGSMVPTLNVGDLIVVQGVSNASEIRAAPSPEGDIIVFYKPGTNELIVHRAINKVRYNGVWYFETKGDANSSPDRWGPITNTYGDTYNGMISEKLLVGKVIKSVPWVGHIPLFMRTPLGILLVISLFAVLIVIDFIFPSKKGENETKK
jgi:signal peptidase